MSPTQIVLLTLLAVVVFKLVVLLVLGKGSFARLGLATQAFVKLMADPELAEQVEPILNPPPTPPEPEGQSPEPLRILSLLHRESRLLDFLLEDIAGASDDQIAAAVRDVHPKAQATLKEHLVLEPVMDKEEESQVEVPKGFDPWAIQMEGNLAGEPPFTGSLVHRGWRVKEYTLPEPTEGQDLFVLAPAIVDVP